MTVLLREELNDADLAWAAAEPSVANVMGQLLSARMALGIDYPTPAMTWRDGRAVEPDTLRARGAL